MANSALPLILLAGAAFFLMGRDGEEEEEGAKGNSGAGNGGSGDAGATGATGGDTGSTGATGATGGLPEPGLTGATGSVATLVPQGSVTATLMPQGSDGAVMIDGLGQFKWRVAGGKGPGLNQYTVEVWDASLPGLRVVTDSGGVNDRLWDVLADAEAYAIERANLAAESVNVMGGSNFADAGPTVAPLVFLPEKKGDIVVISRIPADPDWVFEAVMAAGSTEDPEDFVDLKGGQMAGSPEPKLIVVTKDGNLPADDLVVIAIPPNGTQADALPLVLIEGTA